MDSFLNKLIDKLYLNSIDHFVNYKKHIKDYAIVIIVALFLRSMLVVIYTIPTGSMIPNLLIGDVLLADRFYYGLKLPFTEETPGYRLPSIKKPQIGDVVVFRAPREETFYRLTIFINNYSSAKELLYNLNKASSFKRPISWRGDKKNYIFENGNENILLLHHSVYEKYKKQLDDPSNGISIASYDKRKYYMSFYELPKNHLFHSIINTPLAGLSIFANVFLDTPLGFPYKLLTTYIYDKIYDIRKDFWQSFVEFRLYPNKYIDTTKDFVKRLIAKEGDKVQIKNGNLYINDIKQKKVRIKTSLKNKFVPYKESLKRRDGTTVEFTTQYLNHLVVNYYKDPNPPFRADLWPYDPNSAARNSLFTNSFGPIIVKKGHYFMMGDNRDESFDCRFLGSVPESAIKGRPFLRVLPASRFGKIK